MLRLCTVLVVFSVLASALWSPIINAWEITTKFDKALPLGPILPPKDALESLWPNWQHTPITKELPRAKEEKAPERPVIVAPTSPSPPLLVDFLPAPPKIAILIDDLGYNRIGMEASLRLPNEVALAILPHTPFARKTARAAQLTQRVILLHAPMENEQALKLGPGGLYASMDKSQLIAALRDDLLATPNVLGMNNHMGSLLTQKTPMMQWVMEVLAAQGLFFIDSLTSPASVALTEARRFGIPSNKRDIFLDNVATQQAIDKQFQRLLRVARKQGYALAIGHPYPQTMHYLQQRLASVAQDGFELVPITQILTTITAPEL